MNKNQFLRKLDVLIKDLPKEERQDILFDYEEHFRIGLEEGKTEEEIAKALGEPESLVKEFVNINNEDSHTYGNIGGFLRNLLNAKKIILDEKEEFNSSNIQKIEINSKNVAVRLYSNTEDDQIRVHLVGKMEAIGFPTNFTPPSLEIKETDGVLAIATEKKGSIMVVGMYNENIQLEVYIPNGKVQDVLVNTASGSVGLEEISLEHLRVESASGSIKVNSSMLKRGMLTTSSGSIKLSSFLGEVTAESLSGSIKLNAVKTNKSLLSTKSGSIKLENVTGELVANTASGSIKVDTSDFIGKLSTMSGTIKGSEMTGDLIAESTSGSIKLDYASLTNGKKINLKTTSGMVKLGLPQDANYELKATTVSGRIDFDSPQPIQATSTSRNSLEGIVGTGGNVIVLESVSGSIKVQTV